eukprot:TRINITY_DN14981_c0_g2_i1.p1 TRINITY_DN14981_c0_g2~~TRINITY_DN14981_c0_g2_i1.p1  ORF type:complete len:453 (+),score=23.55 TRINITY_DN14981_c0_g2_i1:70-1428(+)
MSRILDVSSDEDSSSDEFDHDNCGSDTSDDEDFEGLSGAQTSFNITKGIVGEGMLSLPAGLAAGRGTGVATGILITVFVCLSMAYTFWVVGRACQATREKSHKGVGTKIQSAAFGKLMAATNLVKTVFTCTAYALVIGQTANELLSAFGIAGFYATRQFTYIVILVCILLPLCLLRDLSILSWSSLAGVACEVCVVMFMVLRLADGSYQEGGVYHDTIPEAYRPAWSDVGGRSIWRVSFGTMILAASLSTAFLAHYNAPKFYHQLRGRTTRRFGGVTMGGFAAALILYVVAMVAGYLTFGTNVSGNCLKNYSPDDPLAFLARSLMLIAVTCGFPIAFNGLRDATIQTLAVSSRRQVWVTLTLCLLTPISVLACALDDLGALNSLGGSVLGSLITLIYPGLIIRWAYTSKLYRGDFTQREGNLVGPVYVVYGVAMMLFATSMVICVKILKIRP